MVTVRRFVSFNLWSRQGRLATLTRKDRREMEGQAGKIIDAAHHLLESPGLEKTSLVFAGSGMRPLFEAVRGVNEVIGAKPRKHIIYVVTPKKADPSSHLHVSMIAEKLKGKVSRKPGAMFHIIDSVGSGNTLNAIRDAVLSLNPGAQVGMVTDYSRNPQGMLMKGVNAASGILPPAEKDFLGRVVKDDDKTRERKEHSRNMYLLYQKLLQEHLQELQRQRGMKQEEKG